MQSRTHLSIYDEFLTDRKFERIVSEIEGRLSALGLQGPIVRLSPLRSAKEMVQSSVRDGVSTIVIVGDDVTVDRVMSFLPDLGLPIGYLPIRSPCRIAERFGIRSGLSACDVLAARHLDIVDVGVINDQYFLHQVFLEKSKATLSIPGEYRLHADLGADISISNIDGNLHDGRLLVRMKPSESTARSWGFHGRTVSETLLRVPEVHIESDVPIRLRVDVHEVEGKVFRLGIKPGGMRWITGRQGIAKSH